MIDEERIRKRMDDFTDRFGTGDPPDLYFAPGRANLIGEHTDYNGGLVLPMAVEQGTYLLINRSDSEKARIYSAALTSEAQFDPSEVTRSGDWSDYVKGVCLFVREIVGDVPPFNGLYFGDLPLEGGLSSSASLETVTAFGMNTLGLDVRPSDAVKVSRRAENDFVGVSCGVMDQFTVAFASENHAILLDCDTLDFRLVPFNLPGTSAVVVHSGIGRSLQESPYNLRRRECEQALSLLSGKLGPKRNLSKITANEFSSAKYVLPEVLRRRAEHVIYENIRVEEAARCLEAGDPERLGQLMNRSHSSLRDLFEVSSPELDTLQEISNSQMGVRGCRMMGAGFGGCVIALVDSEHLEEFRSKTTNMYWKATGNEPLVIVTGAGRGARKL